MPAPIMYSDEDLYQQAGTWEGAALLRDQQNNALNQYNSTLANVAPTPAPAGLAALTVPVPAPTAATGINAFAANAAAPVALANAPVGTGKITLPAYGEVSTQELQNWEPWRLAIYGLNKDSSGNITSAGKAAWETGSGPGKTLFDQIYGVSKLPGMSGAYQGQGRKKRASAGPNDGRRKRAEIVKRVMAQKGMKMIEASKYVKEHGLY